MMILLHTTEYIHTMKKHDILNTYLLGARPGEGNCMFCDPETAMLPGRTLATSFPEGPVNKCFINISSAKVKDSIKKTKTVFIEQNDTK